MKFTRTLFPLLLLLFLLTACSFSLAEDITPPPGSEVTAAPEVDAISGPLYPMVAPNPENGAPIYAEKCAPCHGVSGQGDGPQAAQLPNPAAPLGSPDFARLSTPARWYHQVTQGNMDRFMPPFNSLTDRERWDVVGYTYSLSISEETLSRGRELYDANCAGCHGETGRGDGPQAASLAAAPVDLTQPEWMAEKSSADFFQAITEGAAPAMPAFGTQLNEDERWILADYLRMLLFTPAGEMAAESGASQLEAPTPSEVAVETQPGAAGEADAAGTPVAAENRMGTVTGKVTNGSGSELPKDLVITLHGFDQMQSVVTDTTTIAPDGTYTFENVKMPEGRAFLVAVEHGEATYGSDVAVVEPDMDRVELPVTVYDTTTDASVLVGNRLHLFFEFVDDQTVRVIELYILDNPGDKTVVAKSEGEPTVTFKLPEGAANLQFQEGVLGGRYIETPDGFGDTVAIRPGQGAYQVLFAFDMPYERRLELVQPVSFPINAAVILVPEGGIKIKSEMFQDAGVRDVEGTAYRTYNSSPLTAGQELRLTMTGRPGSGSPSLGASSTTNLVIGLGAFGLALILAGLWLYTRGRARGPDGNVEEESGAADLGDDPETVMDAILALDDLYQAGELPEEAYRQRRLELKARLKEIMG